MRTRTMFIALAATLALGACTSGEPPETDAPSDDAAASESAAADGSATNGWLCDDISPPTLRTLAGGELDEPVQVQVQDDEVRWVCEARDGDTPLMRLTVEPGEEARDAAREQIQALDGVDEGPEYLGESYVAPTLVVGLTLCRDADATGSNDHQPYTMIAESLVESEEDLSGPLRSTLAQTARGLDQRYGCSPKMALDDDSASTTG